ncbi:nucleotidyltransferase domain-containing protein [Anaerotruncus sp. 80]|uniref:Nucleotidyltransferase domain-containing protein n=1 Tax=Anaerotruncus colihominis TaxID=169435 RepID=A0A845QNB0_9FIRM|nr:MULTISPECIES: nucleotidyltransferase domain-containing protein [Anaerotruncus]MCI9640451.1 nucleotidyltransferase domain-containing protein [Emergencia sp.]NBH62213.1 nucleotidyltransferase domain-containing protein [Anaerotruncus colihominis]NCF02868.1 nucleotidyltransferase domain-containing protein [Anaerotruncus sp. 80]
MKLWENTGIKACVVEEIRTLAQKHHIEKVVLFGSRARGDFQRTSDIDLASRGGDFVRFSLDVDEETSTLLQYDIVNLDGAVSDALRSSIEKEGRIIYEKI